ncbi:TetR family transcriptional regulator [Microbacterium trichothecenolyticum]|uniref:Fatty acid metabolism regulator protein n=1 Tax=Microbacterium trichothecenolyticum TaxID=69370 RepID=A0A0M2HGG5_MICTR|nr:TetR family transcriptional regulator [Microbacterium trichothecenolyticum]KJL43394.1 Fatty acid metabolism regulator protein [Microbacterium trichothecenolyticum]
MSTEPRAGRPKASSRETIAEAACELFLEQGYEQTSIVDIARRAGVSRSSFFNYFSSKSDVLWAGLDERLTVFEQRLEEADGTDAPAAVRAATLGIAESFAPDSLALGIVNAGAMGLEAEYERDAALRRARVARAVAARLLLGGADRVRSEVAGAAWGGAVLAAIEAWAHDGAGRTSLVRFLSLAADAASPVSSTAPVGDVAQLRVVVQAAAFDQTLAFYRDVVGMPQAEAYEADGGARVAILAAGRATLEIANPAQVDFIDRVETDGDAPSDRIRLALEVVDTATTASRLADAGAEIEASARETPWRSVNARLRGPAGLQLTLFQELGPAD